jgi:hypothetical protein
VRRAIDAAADSAGSDLVCVADVVDFAAEPALSTLGRRPEAGEPSTLSAIALLPSKARLIAVRSSYLSAIPHASPTN